MANDLWGASDLNLATMTVNSPNLVLGGGFELTRITQLQLIAPTSAENLNGYGGPSIHPMTGLGAPFGLNGNFSYTSGWDAKLDFYKVSVGVGDATAILPPLLLPCAIVIDNQALGDETEFILQFKQHFTGAGQYSVTLALYGGWLRMVIPYKSTDFPDGSVVLPVSIPVELYNQVAATGYDMDSSPLYHSGLTIFINGNLNASSGLSSFGHAGFPISIGHVADVKSNYLYIKDIDFFAGVVPREFVSDSVGNVRQGLLRYSRAINSKAKGLVTGRTLRIPPHPEMIRRRQATPACVESSQRPAKVSPPECAPVIVITTQPVDAPSVLGQSASVTFTCKATSTHVSTLTYTWHNAETNAVIKTESGSASSTAYAVPADVTALLYAVYCVVSIPGQPHLPTTTSNVAVAMLRDSNDTQDYAPPVITAPPVALKPDMLYPKDVILVQLSHTGAFKAQDFKDGLAYTDAPLIYSHPPLDAFRNSLECPWICDAKIKSRSDTGVLIIIEVDFYITDLSVDFSGATFSGIGAANSNSGTHFKSPIGEFITSKVSDDYSCQVVTARWTGDSPTYGEGCPSYFYINNGKSSRILIV